MKSKSIALLVLALLAAVLVIQNSQLTELRLAFWPIYAPLFVLALIVLVIGFALGYLAGRRGRKKAERTQGTPAVPPAKNS
jgi:uncharacterized integral membrane protein